MRLGFNERFGPQSGSAFSSALASPHPPQPASLLQQRPEELAARWHEVPHPRGWSWLGMEGDGEAEGGGFGRAGGGPAETRGCNLLMRLPTDP